MIRKAMSPAWVFVFTGFLTWSVGAICPAQQPAQPPDPAGKAAKPADADDAEVRVAGPDDVEGPRLKFKVAKINSLRKMVEEKVDLNPAQKGIVRKLFNDYISDLKANVPTKQNRTVTKRNKIYPPTVEQLEEDLADARKKGDVAKAAEIERQITLAKKTLTTPVDDQTYLLLEAIKKELKPDQLAQFEKVVERWHAISPRGPRTGSFQQLRRALADPEVGMSEEQKKATDAILQDTLKEVRMGGSRSPEKMEESVTKARIAIFEKLTPEQQMKVNANLKTFKAEDIVYDDSKARAFKEKEKKSQDKAGDDK